VSDPVRRVLVIDADATTADTVEAALPSSGFEVVTAANAARALSVIREGRADVVLSELLLPDDSGLHLLVESRLRHPLIPRIVVTALQDFQSAVTAINEAEVFRFLPKPLDPPSVRAAVLEALGRAATLHEARGVREKAERRRLALVDLETDFPGITLVSHGPEGYFIPPQRIKRLAERLKETPLGQALARSIEETRPA
jgi:two-component system probable response regulator PhcQ